jgi:hypothetical protein
MAACPVHCFTAIIKGKTLLTGRRTDPAHHLQHVFFRPGGGPCVIFGGFRAL